MQPPPDYALEVPSARLDRPAVEGARASRPALALPAINYYRALFWVYVSITLLIFTFLVPPFQKADEQAHWWRAVAITNKDVVCDTDANGVHYFLMKRKWVDLPENFHLWELAFHYDVKFDKNWLRTDFSDPVNNQYVPVFRFCSLPVAGYLPNAFGILLGKPLQNPIPSFYLGRLAGATFFVVSILAALRIAPDHYKLLIYFYAAVPMVLHQVSAISYDVVQLSLFPLLFAYLTKFLVEDEVIQTVHLLAFMTLMWWVVNVRLFAYIPIVTLFFVLRPSRIAPRFSRYALVTGAFLGFTTVTTGLFHLIFLPWSEDSVPPDYGIDASEQAKFVLGHPFHFLAACYKTLQVQGELLLKETIGVFGWIDYAFSFMPYYVFVFIAGAFLYYTIEKDSPLLRPSQIVVLFGVIALTVGFLFFSLYAVWSPVGADAVSGLQGRYFLGLLPFGVLLCSQTAAVLGRDRLMKVLVLALVVVIIYNIFRAVELRYY